MYSQFDNQLDNFMLYCVSRGLTRKTMRSYEQSLRLFSAFLTNEYKIDKPNDVKTYHIRSYIKYLKERGKYTVVSVGDMDAKNNPTVRRDYRKPIADTTIANYVRNIKVFFAFLYREREITSDPAKKVENVKPKRKEKHLLTEQQLRQLLAAFDTTTFHGYRNWLVTRLILDTGVRIGECLELKPQQLDFRARTILVTNTKNGHERYIYMSETMRVDMKRWLMYRDRFSSSEYLFPTTRGTKLSTGSFEAALNQVGEKVGVKVFPHLLRNNFAKYYLLGGGDFATLSRILGHSSVEVTQKAYLDFTTAEVMRKYQVHSPLNNLNL